jgi:hypothetical protein
MKDYKSKKSINKIAFANNSEVLIFDNTDYTLVGTTKVIFNQIPKII